MKKTLTIEGMTCNHCVMSVTKALENIPDVKSAKVTLEDKKAVLKLKNELSDTILTGAIEDAGYKVTEIR